MLIQDIFKQYGKVYLKKYSNNIPAIHKKALIATMNCRTKNLGGEVYYCNKCDKYHYSYHSCQNRHCVVCQNNNAQKWIENHKSEILPVTYFLSTFTIPQQLRKPARKNQRLFYSILFKASSESLKLLAKDKKYLGGEIAMIGILHTWTRALIYHPHVHYLIPGVAMGCNDKKVRFSDDDFLMHVKALSIIFKAKFRDILKEQAPEIFNTIADNVWNSHWVVHIKSVGNGEKALEYMGRYLFRVAISNNRIIKFCKGKVTFRYTDYKTGKTKVVTLEVLEFIRRFLQHVLPHNFMKVRYYGFLAAASKKKLSRIRRLLHMESVPRRKKITKPAKVLSCPVCGSPLQWIETIPRE